MQVFFLDTGMHELIVKSCDRLSFYAEQRTNARRGTPQNETALLFDFSEILCYNIQAAVFRKLSETGDPNGK